MPIADDHQPEELETVAAVIADAFRFAMHSANELFNLGLRHGDKVGAAFATAALLVTRIPELHVIPAALMSAGFAIPAAAFSHIHRSETIAPSTSPFTPDPNAIVIESDGTSFDPRYNGGVTANATPGVADSAQEKIFTIPTVQTYRTSGEAYNGQVGQRMSFAHEISEISVTADQIFSIVPMDPAFHKCDMSEEAVSLRDGRTGVPVHPDAKTHAGIVWTDENGLHQSYVKVDLSKLARIINRSIYDPDDKSLTTMERLILANKVLIDKIDQSNVGRPEADMYTAQPDFAKPSC